MGEKAERDQAEKGLSAGVLAILFLVCVGVCAVFFSLGFLVGYNEQATKLGPPAERVTSPPVVPPTVNPPLETREPPAKEPAGTATSAAALRPREGQEPRVQPQPAAESKPSTSSPRTSETEIPPQASTPNPASQKEAAPASTGAATSGEVGMGFAVQVAASATREDAEKVVEILKKRGYPVFLVTPEYARANDNLFRVQVGPFPSRDDAEKVRVKLAEEGFKQPFIRP